MTQTAMRWGFDHGDGWFEISWQLNALYLHGHVKNNEGCSDHWLA